MFTESSRLIHEHNQPVVWTDSNDGFGMSSVFTATMHLVLILEDLFGYNWANRRTGLETSALILMHDLWKGSSGTGVV